LRETKIIILFWGICSPEIVIWKLVGGIYKISFEKMLLSSPTGRGSPTFKDKKNS
jgi:hypothetical protein